MSADYDRQKEYYQLGENLKNFLEKEFPKIKWDRMVQAANGYTVTVSGHAAPECYVELEFDRRCTLMVRAGRRHYEPIFFTTINCTRQFQYTWNEQEVLDWARLMTKAGIFAYKQDKGLTR